MVHPQLRFFLSEQLQGQRGSTFETVTGKTEVNHRQT